MAEIYVPNFMSFQNDNTFLGSFQGLRFKLSPDVKEEVIQCEYWYGPLSYDFSDMAGAETFPLSTEGIDQMRARLVFLSEHRTENREATV